MMRMGSLHFQGHRLLVQKILMVDFYKNLMSGKTKHQSLKDAQKHLRQVDNGKYDAPKYWASFIMLDGLN